MIQDILNWLYRRFPTYSTDRYPHPEHTNRLDQLELITPLTDDHRKRLSLSVVLLSRRTQFSEDTLFDALEQGIYMGLSSDQLCQVIHPVAEFADSHKILPDIVIDHLTTITTTYNCSVDESSEILDMIGRTVTEAPTTVSEVLYVLTRVGPQASYINDHYSAILSDIKYQADRGRTGRDAADYLGSVYNDIAQEVRQNDIGDIDD